MAGLEMQTMKAAESDDVTDSKRTKNCLFENGVFMIEEEVDPEMAEEIVGMSELFVDMMGMQGDDKEKFLDGAKDASQQMKSQIAGHVRNKIQVPVKSRTRDPKMLGIFTY
jgi:hypothetical protein